LYFVCAVEGSLFIFMPMKACLFVFVTPMWAYRFVADDILLSIFRYLASRGVRFLENPRGATNHSTNELVVERPSEKSEYIPLERISIRWPLI
jgi:hypothetical protein